MQGGYAGKWLSVDLTSGKISEEVQDDAKLKKYGGQVGMVASPLLVQFTVDHFNAVTGQSLTKDDAYLIGERLANLARSFNVRHGFKPVNDLDVGPRLLEAPINGGAAGKSIAPYLEDMVREFNRLNDWDYDTGKPSKAKLEQLGLDEVIKEFY